MANVASAKIHHGMSTPKACLQRVGEQVAKEPDGAAGPMMS